MAKGRTNREIAERLLISEQGVRYHLNQVYQKLGLESREALVDWHRSARSPLGRLAALPMPALGALAKGAAYGVAGVALVGAGVAVYATRGDTADPTVTVVERTATPAPSTMPASESCTVESPLLDGPREAECFANVAALAEGLTFTLIALPSDVAPALDLAARVDVDGAKLALLRFDPGTGPVDVMVGDFKAAVLLESNPEAGVWPLAPMHDDAAPIVLRAYRAALPAASLIYWCPEWSVAEQGSGASFGARCPTGPLVAIAGVPPPEDELLLHALVRERNGLAPPPELTPVPMPTPTGGRAEPLVAGVPLYSGAVEVDGWYGTGGGSAGPVDQAVQQFETDDADAAVLAWYSTELLALGYTNYHGSGGVSGRSMEFTRNGETEWVGISTYYIPPPGYVEAEPAPGFRGKGVPFDLRQGGPLRFYIITWTQ